MSLEIAPHRIPTQSATASAEFPVEDKSAEFYENLFTAVFVTH
jgi:hypothetical protein